MPEYKDILYEQDGPVVTITLNRPDMMNAISLETDKELHAALDHADEDDSVRVIILTGAGKAFSAGYDISHMPTPEKTMAGVLRYWWNRDIKMIPPRWYRIMEMDKPVIAAVNGYCMGGGFFYAMICDMTYASDRAVFAQSEVRHTSNTSAVFSVLAGWKHANRYALTGDHFDGHEAHRIGVVNEVVPHDELMPTVRKLAHRIAMVPRDCVRLNKALQNQTWQAMGLRTAITQAGYLSVIVHSSYDAEDAAHLQEARFSGDMRKFLKDRDDPFRPEPFGPRAETKD